MTTGADTLTTNLRLSKVYPDRKNWADTMNNNLSVIDAVIGTYINVNGIRGAWANSTEYDVGDIVADSITGSLYLAREVHISAAIPTTFAQDRAAHTTHWSVVEDAPIYRGTWLTATYYVNNDFVLLNNVYYVCRTNHTSGTFATDLAASKWDVVLDFSAAVAGAAAAAISAAAALVSQNAAAVSAAAALVSQNSATASAASATASALSATASAASATTDAATATTGAATATTQAATAVTYGTLAKTYGIATMGALSSMTSQTYAVLQQLQQALASGVSSFNGRTGVVVTTVADFQSMDDQIILRNQVFN